MDIPRSQVPGWIVVRQMTSPERADSSPEAQCCGAGRRRALGRPVRRQGRLHKANGVDPQAYIAVIIGRVAGDRPARQMGRTDAVELGAVNRSAILRALPFATLSLRLRSGQHSGDHGIGKETFPACQHEHRDIKKAAGRMTGGFLHQYGRRFRRTPPGYGSHAGYGDALRHRPDRSHRSSAPS